MLPTFVYNINNFINRSCKLGNRAYYPTSPHYLSISFMKYETTQRSDLTTQSLMKSMLPSGYQVSSSKRYTEPFEINPSAPSTTYDPWRAFCLDICPIKRWRTSLMSFWPLRTSICQFGFWPALSCGQHLRLTNFFRREKAHLNHLLYSFVWLPESKMYSGVVVWDHAKNASQKGGLLLNWPFYVFFFYYKFDVASLPWINYCYFFRRPFTISCV